MVRWTTTVYTAECIMVQSLLYRIIVSPQRHIKNGLTKINLLTKLHFLKARYRPSLARR